MSRYVTERVNGVWQVRDTVGCHTHGDACIVVYGPGSSGAAAARAGALQLNRTNENHPANELRAWRTAHGLSQAKLAKLLGVQWLAVQRWEAGSRGVPPYLHLALQQIERDLESVH